MDVPGMLDTGATALGDRFNLVNAVPPTVPLVTFILCWRSGAYTGPFMPEHALPNLSSIGLIELIIVPFGILLLGLAIAPFQIALVQVLEGYWGRSPLGLRLTAIGIELQRRRMVRVQALTLLPAASTVADHLRARHAAEQAQRDFPQGELLLPTSLGNILRAAETTAGERYGLDTVESYPRLRQVLSDRLDSALAQLLTQLDTAAALTLSFVLSCLLSLALIPHGAWALVPIAFGVLSGLSYRGAGAAARLHGRLLHAAFDLHRFDLIEHLHYPLPTHPVSEVPFNNRLSAFWQVGASDGDVAEMPGPYAHRSEILNRDSARRRASSGHPREVLLRRGEGLVRRRLPPKRPSR